MKLSTLLRVGVTLVLLGVIAAVVDLRSIAETITGVDLFLYCTAMLLWWCSAVPVDSLVTRRLWAQLGVRLDYVRLLRFNLALGYYAFVLPKGSAAAMRLAAFARHAPVGTGGLVMLFEKAILLMALSLVGLVALLWEMPRLGGPAPLLLLAFLGVFLLMGTALVPHAPGKALGRLLLAVLRAVRLHRLGVAQRWGRALVQDFSALQGRYTLALVGLTLLRQCALVLAGYITLHAMGLDLSLPAIAWIRAATLLVLQVPVGYAGLGTREGTYLVLMGLYGVAPEQAITFSVLMFVQHFSIVPVGAVVELLGQGRLHPRAKPEEVLPGLPDEPLPPQGSSPQR